MIIIQAREGSTRLPNKVLMELSGRSVLQNIIERCKLSGEKVVISTDRDSLKIQKLSVLFRVKCFTNQYPIDGESYNDVLSSYIEIGEITESEYIVRITADCPLVSPRMIDKMVDIFKHGDYDIVTNVFPATFPDGFDVEVVRLSALKKIQAQILTNDYKQHVTKWIYDNPDEFNIYNMKNNIDYSFIRCTLDTFDDYIFIDKIYRHFYKQEDNTFEYEDVMDLLLSGEIQCHMKKRNN